MQCRVMPRTALSAAEEDNMRSKSIVITQSDARILRGLLGNHSGARRDSEHLQELALELERALMLGPDEVPDKVVTLYRPVEVLDLETGARHEVTLVTPAEANVGARRISVLAPLGTALLGYQEGDEVEWLMPGGLRRLRIESVSERPGHAKGASLEESASAC
jgi:regulator of nucleoside diphosphate kinase